LNASGTLPPALAAEPEELAQHLWGAGGRAAPLPAAVSELAPELLAALNEHRRAKVGWLERWLDGCAILGGSWVGCGPDNWHCARITAQIKCTDPLLI
jgi:hypothetical protein